MPVIRTPTTPRSTSNGLSPRQSARRAPKALEDVDGLIPEREVVVNGLELGAPYKKNFTIPIISGKHVADIPKVPAHDGIIDLTESRPPAAKLNEFRCVRHLGEGQYGTVFLVTKKDDVPFEKNIGTLLALKASLRGDMRAFDELEPEEFSAERNRLAEMPWSPFVTGIVQTFHDPVNIYVALEYIPCGTLHDLIRDYSPMGPADAAFYFCNIAAALKFLERVGVSHRDIKPENILVGADGYLCLADFGTANIANTGTHRILLGTPSYMAPEVILGVNSGNSVRMDHKLDWWSSGVILYEMVTGELPFAGASMADVYRNIENANFHWPRKLRVGRLLKVLVDNLLELSIEARWAYPEVSTCRWLRHINWFKVSSKLYMAPFAPPPRYPSHNRRITLDPGLFPGLSSKSKMRSRNEEAQDKDPSHETES